MANYMSISADLRTSEDMIAIIEALLSDTKIGIASICSFSQSKNAGQVVLIGIRCRVDIGQVFQVHARETFRDHNRA